MKEFVKKNIFSILTVLFAISLGISAYFIATHYIQEKQQASEFEELAQIVEQCPENDCDKPYSEELPILSDYAELYLQNEDMVGWISITDTHINYPVMQTVDNPNYYLKKNFNHEYSDYGVPYIQENCNLSNSAIKTRQIADKTVKQTARSSGRKTIKQVGKVTDKYRADVAMNTVAELPETLQPMAEGIHSLIQAVYDDSILRIMYLLMVQPTRALREDLQKIWTLRKKYAYMRSFCCMNYST